MSKKLEPHQAKISSLSHDGRGIAHINNKITFIFGALPGETVEFRYTQFHRQFDEGTVLKVLEASPSRVKAQCEFFGLCGGCSLQHLNIEDQLEHKKSVLLERLQHISHTEPKEILPVLHDHAWGYRHRARLSVHYFPKMNKVVVGFREQNSHRVANITRCEVLASPIGDKIESLSEMLLLLNAKAKIPQIEVIITSAISALVIRHLIPLTENDLEHIRQFAHAHHFHIYLQPKGPQSVYLFYPSQENPLEYNIPNYGVRIQFQPLQFTQINPRINEKMIRHAIELLAPTHADRMLDLFCGIGNFTLPLARLCHSIVGVEGDQEAVLQARRNAELNHIQNATFFTANLFETCDKEPWSDKRFDAILLDPPRAGAKEIIPFIQRFQASRIAYVSCDSATLARDIKSLVELGYTLEKAGTMDMFPHTQHTEAIALLTKKHG